jgi:hypothetical protein
MCIGRDATPVWCQSRQREEALEDSRASNAAVARRMPIRWDPIHGYQQDQVSCLTGSGSSDAYRSTTIMMMSKSFGPS